MDSDITTSSIHASLTEYRLSQLEKNLDNLNHKVDDGFASVEKRFTDNDKRMIAILIGFVTLLITTLGGFLSLLVTLTSVSHK